MFELAISEFPAEFPVLVPFPNGIQGTGIPRDLEPHKITVHTTPYIYTYFSRSSSSCNFQETEP